MRILQRNLKGTTDTHYRHTLQTHTTDTHYRHIPFHFSHNERTPVQIYYHIIIIIIYYLLLLLLLLLLFIIIIIIIIIIIKEMPGSVASGTCL